MRHLRARRAGAGRIGILAIGLLLVADVATGSGRAVGARAATLSSNGAAKQVCNVASRKVNGATTKVRVCTAARLPALSAAPNPYTVALHADSSRAVSKMIKAADGGTIVGTGASGTTFSLTVPPYALDNDTQITLTPITSVDGSPFSGGLIAAALLQPQGLSFWSPVTLTIRPAGPVTVPSNRLLLGFTSNDDGTEFHLSPWTGEASSAALPLWHFTSAGIALGTPGNVATLVQHTSTPLTAAYEQVQAALVARTQWMQTHSKATGLYSTSQLTAQLQRLAGWKFDGTIQPHLEHSLSDAYDGRRAVEDAIVWKSDITGGPDQGYFKKRVDRVQPLVSQVIDHVLSRLAVPCTTAPRSLYSYPSLGWTIDAKDFAAAYGGYRSFVNRQLLPDDNAYLQRLLSPCRPLGFKFSATYRLYAAGNAPSAGPANAVISDAWLDVAVSGGVCGADPYDDGSTPFSNPWKVMTQVTEIGYVNGTKPLFSVLPQSVVSTIAMIQGKWDRAGQQLSSAPSARYRIDATPPASVRFEVLSDPSISPSDQTIDVPLVEDTSCPSIQG